GGGGGPAASPARSSPWDRLTHGLEASGRDSCRHRLQILQPGCRAKLGQLFLLSLTGGLLGVICRSFGGDALVANLLHAGGVGGLRCRYASVGFPLFALAVARLGVFGRNVLQGERVSRRELRGKPDHSRHVPLESIELLR